MQSKPLALMIAASLAVAGCSSLASKEKTAMNAPAAASPTPAPAAASNPFFAPSSLYLQAPPFDQIHDDDYLPAFEEGMRQHTAEIRAIADNPDAPTFDNT